MKDNHPNQSLQKIAGGVSVVLPALNEQDNIQDAVLDAKAALARFAEHYEIIIVDDGSTDRTAEIAEQMARNDPGIRLVRHEKNLGYGAALAHGFKAARLAWIFFTDADRQFRMAEIEKLVPFLAESKMVVGFREKRQDPLLRKIYGAVFSRLVNFLFGLAGKDTNCAFKIFERSIIAGYEFQSPGALVNAELLALAKSKGIEPVQVPVSHFPRRAGSQTGGSLRVVVRAARELCHLYFHRPGP